MTALQAGTFTAGYPFARPSVRVHRNSWTAHSFGKAALKIALVVAGANTAFTGLNRALGGIATLGWQGRPIFSQSSPSIST